jgi:U6 snRNA-associated Sm-like protein LSm6
MNIALEKSEEYVNGKLRRSYGDAFVRGNNGTCFPSGGYTLLIQFALFSVLYISAR